jgi:acyl-CoA reductase-like NAD-dependent aldehyde dehydrogenase
LLHIIQKSAHALATGNVVVIKLSPLACLSAYALAPLIEEAGFPAGTFNFITGGSDAGQALIQESNIDLISFTGSAIIGRTVASAAGAGGKPVHLELGGKAPALVFSDANLEESAKDLAGAAFGSTGQSCTAATRIYVQEEVLGDFRSAFVNAATQFKSGDPFASDTGIGPLISEASWLRIRDLVSDAVDLGAEVLLGKLDRKAPDNGFFMDSVILEGVTDEARIAQEEVFGPVTTLYSFKDEADAITLANAGSHGLAAGVYTNDIHRARHLTASLQAGNIWINGYKKLDPALPFGGVKGSGFSRECGIDGLLAFCQPKTVVESYQVAIGQIPE